MRIGKNALLRAIALTAPLIVTASMAEAATFTWTGGGANSNWTTGGVGGNWGGATATSATDTSIVLGLTGATSAPVVDINNPWVLNGISFVGSAKNVTLTGNPLQFSATGNIINANVGGTFTHSIANNITTTESAASTFNILSGTAGTGNLSIASNITTNKVGSTITFNGTGNNSVYSGGASATGGGTVKISRLGTGTWTFSGANNISNIVFGGAGITKNGANNALGTTAQFDFSSVNGTYDLNGFNQADGEIASTIATSTITNSSATASILTDASSRGLRRTVLASITGNLEFDETGTTGSGSSGITLSGTDTYNGATKMSSGTLYRNGTHTVTTTGTGNAAAYTISGGTFGGNGTINLSAVNQGIAIQSGAKLSPGSADATIGTLTASLGTGVFDISGAVGGSNTGGLVFGTAAIISPSDQVKLTTGTLNIGSGVLNLSDFTFTGTLTTGTYTLFDTNSLITGTLASSGLTGTVNGVGATLALSADKQDLVLIVPEPGACALLLGSAGLLFMRRRDRVDARQA